MEHKPYSVRAMFAVHREIVNRFPDDAGKRCMYGAFALTALLREHGFNARVAAGDFVIFTPSFDGRSAGFHGFAGTLDSGNEAHYWVESEGRIIDSSPLLLHTTTETKIVQPPLIYWPIEDTLPRYLRYNTKTILSDDAKFSPIAEQCATAEMVIQGSRRRMKRLLVKKLKILDGPNFIRSANVSDKWSLAAARFEDEKYLGEPPI